MRFTPALQKLILHVISFAFCFYFTTSQDLKFFIFLAALFVMAFNLWSIVQSINCMNDDDEPFRNVFVKSTRASKTGKHLNEDNVRKFENSIRTASKKLIYEQKDLNNDPSKLYQNFSRESESIQELRRMSLADLSKDRVARETNYFCRDEGSAGKKLRTYLMSTRDEETIANEEKVVEELANYFKTGNEYKSFKIDKHNIQGCYQVVKDYMGSKLEEQIEQLTSDLEEVEQVIHKCFSLTLTLQSYTTQNSITYGELLELVQIIDKKSTVPAKYTNNISAFEIKQEINHIRNKIARLPNFTLAPNILRLMLIVKHLRNEFPEESIIFGDNEREERQRHGEKHIFRVQDDDRCYYHHYSSIKSRCGATPILLFLMHLLKKHNKSTNPLLREIRGEVDVK